MTTTHFNLKLSLLTGCFLSLSSSAFADSYIIQPLSVQSAQQAYYDTKITPQAAPIACANSVDFDDDYSLLFIRDQSKHNVGTTEIIVNLPDNFPKEEFDRENFYAYLMTNSSLDVPISAGNIEGTLPLATKRKSAKALHFLYEEGPQISVNFDRALSSTDYFVISTGFSTMLFDMSNLPDENIVLHDCQNSPNARQTKIAKNSITDHESVIRLIKQQNNIESDTIQQAAAAQVLPPQEPVVEAIDTPVTSNATAETNLLADEAEFARKAAVESNNGDGATIEPDYINPVVSMHDNGIYTVPAVRRSGPDGEIMPLDTRTKIADTGENTGNKATNISAGGIDIKNYEDASDRLFAASETVDNKEPNLSGKRKSNTADLELIDSLTLKIKILEIEKEAMRKKLVKNDQATMFRSPDDIINECEVKHDHHRKPSRWPFPFKKW